MFKYPFKDLEKVTKEEVLNESLKVKKNIKESVDNESLEDYEVTIFKNTACAERRQTKPGEADNDTQTETFSASSDLDAMQYVIGLVSGYDEDEIKEEYPDIESCKEYFDNKDWSDGSPFAIYIKSGDRFLYDSSTTIDDLIDEYSEEDYDYEDDEVDEFEDYEDDDEVDEYDYEDEDEKKSELIATYYFGYVGGASGTYYDGALFRIFKDDLGYYLRIDDSFYTKENYYDTEKDAYDVAVYAITPDDGSELIVDKNSETVEARCGEGNNKEEVELDEGVNKDKLMKAFPEIFSDEDNKEV